MVRRRSSVWCSLGLLCISCELSPSRSHRYHTPLPPNHGSSTNLAASISRTNQSPIDARTIPDPAPDLNSKPARTNQPVVDVKAIERELMDADREFARRCQEKGIADAFFEFLDADALCLPAGGMPIHGRDAVRVKLAANIISGVLGWTPVAAQAATSGDLGYTWGTYELRGENAEGPGRTSYGKYVCIWKKQKDGSWKVVLQSSSSSPAPVQRRQ